MIDKGYLLGERYRIIDVLGEGGMANVYLAEDIILQRQVAVKILRFDLQKEPQTLARFQREALATSELSHPNIVLVLDVGTDQGLPYMVMEYVDGPDLKEYIKQNYPLALPEIIRIMDQILSAMTLAHKHNVIHRDLKPQNILLDQHGNVKIADFGIAVALNQSTVTQTNSAIGSVHYMSPEQTRGGLITKQSDIYSLGIILYELITGKVPFDGETAVSIALKHAQEELPSIKKTAPEVPQALENVVLKAAAKDPRDRYSSAQEMKADLDTSLDPSRGQEPVFSPQHGLNNDETIILPNFSKTKTNSKQVKAKEEVDQAVAQPQKSSFLSNFKLHKFWWLFIGLAAIAIVLMMIFALSGRDDNVSVPDVSNVSEQAARRKLKQVGLSVGQVHHHYSDDVDKGDVIKTSPSPGKQVVKGLAIELVVSKGPKLVQVPDVTGDDYDDAMDRLEDMGFDVIRKSDYSESIEEDHVISQSIAAGVEVKPSQTTITLLVSKGKYEDEHPKEVKLPNLKGMSLKKAQKYANENDLILQITQDYSDKVRAGEIITMSPAAGTKIKPGSTIMVSVSRGKEERNSSKIKTFMINYNSSTAHQNSVGNHIQIYVEDDSHSLTNIYRDLYIKRDTSFSVPFSLENGDGHLKVIRDGQTVLNEKVIK